MAHLPPSAFGFLPCGRADDGFVPPACRGAGPGSGCVGRSQCLLASKENVMRRILVAVDGTPASREAARTALEFAEHLCQRVTFVHVLPARMAEKPGEAPEFAAFENACEEYAEELLKEACVSAGKRAWSVNSQIAHGEPAAVISALAADEDVDLVIVGARERGSLVRTLLGSVSGELVSRCPKPVMVVPERSSTTKAQPALAAAGADQ